MQNSTYFRPSTLIFTFGELTNIKYMYIMLTFTGYMLVILLNCFVVSVVALNKSLHEPMYVFVAALAINGLYGSTAFYPSLFVNLLSETHSISYVACMIQVFIVHTYVSCEITILTVMAYDRYVCICNPLRYNNLVNLPKAFRFLVAAWIYSILVISIHIALTIRLPLCSTVILKVYCDNWSVVRLSCIDVTVNNVYGLLLAAIFLGALPVFILFSYILILRACAKSSKDFRTKAWQTCTPHLICIINFITSAYFEILVYRFVPADLPYELRTVMAVQVIVMPPLLNPLIYGMKMKEFRIRILQRIHRKKISVHSLST